jgi:hypothetical protein
VCQADRNQVIVTCGDDTDQQGSHHNAATAGFQFRAGHSPHPVRQAGISLPKQSQPAPVLPECGSGLATSGPRIDTLRMSFRTVKSGNFACDRASKEGTSMGNRVHPSRNDQRACCFDCVGAPGREHVH